MGETPDEIRRQIEETREDMTETVREIAERANVPHRLKETFSEKKEEWLGNEAPVSVDGLAGQLQSVWHEAQARPRVLAAGTFILGLVAGRLIGGRGRG